jgi:uncharacterized RDD family membrane protein YckC
MIVFELFIASSLALALGAAFYLRVLTPIAERGLYYTIAVAPIAIPLWLFDVAYNATFGSIMFAELPNTWTFSDRLQKHVTDGKSNQETWRSILAVGLAKFVNMIEDAHIHM